MKLGILVNKSDSPSSFYRAIGPFSHLAREHSIELMSYTHWHWPKMLDLDAVFIHCAMTPEHIAIMQMCQSMNIPVWVDYDDHMSGLSRDNSAYDYIMNGKTQHQIDHCLSLASKVTVSTAHLERVFGERCDPGKIEVVLNALDDYTLDFHDSPRTKTVVWRGGPAHQADSEESMPVFRQAAKLYPDWHFHFIGYPHWSVDTLPKGSYTTHGWNHDIIDYFKLLSDIQPAIMYVPMKKTPFNLSKSNCSWIEGTMAGAVTIAPDWPEFQVPGCLTGSFLVDVMEHPEKWQQLLDWSRNDIKSRLLLSTVNEQRFAILYRLASKRRKVT